MKRALVLLLCWLAIVGPLPATTYYFSNCASGGTGTISDPYCLNADGDATKESAALLFDNTGTEAVGGDTIILCCDGNLGDGTSGCEDGAVACTYDLDCTGKMNGAGNAGNYWIVIDNDFDANPITITGALALDGDTVTLTGDSPVDGTRGVFDGTRQTCSGNDDDISYAFVSNATLDGIGEYGNGGLIVEDLIFNRWGDGVWFTDGDFGNNPADFIFRRVEISEMLSAVWGDTDGIGDEKESGACDGSGDLASAAAADGAWAVYHFGGCGDFLIEDSVMHTICGFAFRNVVNLYCDHTWTVRNTEIYNVYQVSNDWEIYDWANTRGQTTTYEGNHIWDFTGGIGVERHARNVTIDGNILECRGTYRVSDDSNWTTCSDAITICEAFGDSEHEGSCADVAITGNRIFGAHKTGDSTSLDGWLWGGVKWKASCRSVGDCVGTNDPWQGCTGVGAGTVNSGGNYQNWGCADAGSYTMLIENNFFYRIDQDEFGGRDWGRAALNVDADYPVTIQNNTFVSNSYAIELDDGPATSGVTHILTNNYVVDAYDGEEVFLDTTVNATLTNNNLRNNTGGTGNVYVKNGATTSCANLAGTIGTGNICSEALLVECDVADWCNTVNTSNEQTWDLHLHSSDTVNKNTGTTGATEDIDGDSRPQGGATDIGADELVESAAASQAIVISAFDAIRAVVFGL